MHESLVVIMMILSPSTAQSGPYYDWKPGGYYASKAVCEDMAAKIYKQQKILADRTSPTHKYDSARVANAMIGHVCGDDPVTVKK